MTKFVPQGLGSGEAHQGRAPPRRYTENRNYPPPKMPPLLGGTPSKFGDRMIDINYGWAPKRRDVDNANGNINGSICCKVSC